jgi:hypothetical protein
MADEKLGVRIAQMANLKGRSNSAAIATNPATRVIMAKKTALLARGWNLSIPNTCPREEMRHIPVLETTKNT